MIKLRKRAIYNSMKNHCIALLYLYDSNELSRACTGVSIISLKREVEICHTLSQYSHIATSVLGDCSANNEEWFKRLYDFY